jgi:aminomethyltransferase
VAASETLRRTPLFERHAAAGARFIAFAGWEMPVLYRGPPHPIGAEHMSVRQGAGIFDVSHMGQIETSGPQAGALLARVLSNDVEGLPVGGAQYSVICRDDGGVLDDVITYRLDDRFLTVTNAANHDRDLAWLLEHADGFAAQVADASTDYAMLAVQGPRAREIVQALADRPLPGRMTAGERFVNATEVLVCGTGYTGEDGVELLVAGDRAPDLWDALVARGAAPAGLAARDTLRLEACLPLYGNELTLARGPIEAGLGWCCRAQAGFVGSAAVAAVRAAGPAEKLVAFTIDGPGISRQGDPVSGGGVVTSGTLSPCLEAGIGMAYVPAARAVVGETLEIEVRGTTRRALVTRRPFVPKRG